ncbi:MAG: MBL fold metallo-hydrolase [Deltaproteobacteria bacterium]|nr:MBL fold metallo-hydrolase [Deltaproteobacteria bacterium]MBW2659257.1 MBL fold metallo-hydrolase [Deltaproteobacteria bacterium]
MYKAGSRRVFSLQVRFWGVRGSIPSPGLTTGKYGGNTACVELRVGEQDRVIIIDAGSGIRALGNALMADVSADKPVKAEIFLSHTHWDHIMGYLFFAPVYSVDASIKVYGPVTFEDDPLEDVVGGQMKYRYFPVNLGELSADIEYIRLNESPSINLGDGLQLATKLLNHPLTALGYRFEYDGKVVCTCFDTEPFRNLFITDSNDPDYDEAMAAEGEQVAAEMNMIAEQFFAGADLLIHDAHYTEEEYTERVNWGHSSIEYAIGAANRAGVKKLALFHHDPDRTDQQLDDFTEEFCTPGRSGDTEVFFAREGMVVKL